MTPSGAEMYRPVAAWQKPARQGGDLCDVAVDSEDRVYVLSRGESCVTVFDPLGTELARWGAELLSRRPHGLTVGPDDTVYCADENDHTVRRFTSDGTLLMTIGIAGVPSDTGVEWSLSDADERLDSIVRGAGPFNRPTKVAVSDRGDLYVTDGYGNARVHHFSGDGELVRSWGAPGSAPGEFRIPHSICITPDDRLLVADRENDRIQVFDLDGELLDVWTGLQRPACVVVDRDGYAITTELQQPKGRYLWTSGARAADDSPARITVLDPRGRPVARLGTEGPPCAPGSFASPHGLAIDSAGDIYVAEPINSYHSARQTAGEVSQAESDPLVRADCHALQKLTRA
jgi:sugar lactone lactonase YvrE